MEEDLADSNQSGELTDEEKSSIKALACQQVETDFFYTNKEEYKYVKDRANPNARKYDPSPAKDELIL